MSFCQRAAAAAFVCCWLVAASAHAGLRTIEQGEEFSLEPDEGLLLVVFDTDEYFEYGEVRASGAAIGAERIDNIEARRVVLLAGSAATYRYGKLQHGSSGMTSRRWYDLGNDHRLRCAVEPGVVNYCGDVRLRATARDRSVIALRNRSAAGIADLDRAFPGLRAKYPFHYRGRHADPYPAWLATLERDAKSAPTLADLPDAPKTGALEARQLFKAARIQTMSINPAGTLLLEVGYLGTNHIVSVIDVASGRAADLYRGLEEPLTAAWAGDRSLVLEFDIEGLSRRAIVAKLTHEPGSVPQVNAGEIAGSGFLVDPLPADDNHVLYSHYEANRGYGLYRLDISRGRVAGTQFEQRRRVGDAVQEPTRWLTDARGEIQAVVTDGPDATTVSLVRNGRAEKVATVAEGERFVPVSVDQATGDLLVITDRDREFTELCRFTPGAAQPLATLAAVEGADVLAVARTSSGEVVGIRYYQEGRPRVRYLDRGRSNVQAALEKAFPATHVIPVDRSRDERVHVVLVEGPATPPAYYLFDRDKRAIELLGHAYPQLAGQRFVVPKRIVAKARDGLEIEAFLFAPPDSRGAPLVAMPHGGPIGVFDVRHFDHEAQFLATRGYGVLQVNYRGSGGRGRKLRDAGLRATGRQIEEDVAAAIDAALTEGRFDPGRICIAGASYGGYSALRSVMRWPERFRCAVSIAGMTDLPLQFTGSDISDEDARLAALSEWVGDPKEDASELRELSPLYSSAPLAKPVLLVHGTEDDRVPYEHALRLKRSLELRGSAVPLVTLEGEGHSIRSLDAKAKAWEAIERFLGAHLMAPDNVKSGSP